MKLAEPETPGSNDLAKPQGFNAHSFPAGIWPAPSSIFIPLIIPSLLPPTFLLPYYLHNLAYSCCSEKLLRHFDGGRVKASCSCDLQGMKVITAKNDRHIPWILKIISWAHSNGKSLPYLESVHLGAERFISIPTTEFSLCVQKLCALMLHDWVHEDKKRRERESGNTLKLAINIYANVHICLMLERDPTSFK